MSDWEINGLRTDLAKYVHDSASDNPHQQIGMLRSQRDGLVKFAERLIDKIERQQKDYTELWAECMDRERT